MDLMTLDSNQQPAKMVELYDSLIWTERYGTCGDFQITTGNVDQFMTMLPEGTVLGLRESTVPMIVESHLIERKKGTPVKLTIKGREFTSILDRRVSVRDLFGTTEWTYTLATPMDAAYLVMHDICVDELLGPLDTFPSSLVQFVYGAFETSTSPIINITIPRQNLLKTVQDFLASAAPADPTTTPPTEIVVPHGLRAVRPPDGTTTAIQIQIYKGTDKSAIVYFDATRDLLDDGSYLFSKVGSANAAFCISQDDTFEVDTGAPLSGMDRRVILVDASNSNLEDDAVAQSAKASLGQALQTAMFDGSINTDLNPYTFNVDYGLGDIVKLVGDYGLSGSARVTEYIRSEDNTGSKAYPTLTTINAS